MDALTPLNIVVAFAAGVLSFLSPCMLPLVPGYLAVIGAGPADDATVGRRVRAAGWFVAGFAVVFVLLGFGAGFAGGALIGRRRAIEIIGGLVIAALGVAMVSERLMPMALQRRLGGQLRVPSPGRAGTFGFGAVFGAAWSPCIGPTLGAILTLAASGQSPVAGAVLLAVFAAGLGVPFLLIATGAAWMGDSLGWFKRHSVGIRVASGVLLITFGVLLAIGWVGRLSARLSGIPGIEI